MISEHAIPRTIDDSAAQAFEQAWLAKRAEPIERYLPLSDHPHYLATVEELVQIELEFAWSAFATGGPTPTTIEDYLRRFPELAEPKALLRLLRQEFRDRRGQPNAPTLAEYVRRFPEIVISGAEITSGLDEAIRLTGYEILGKVGAGGMGIVYEARQPDLDRVVAIKTIRGHRAGHPSTDRCLAEARVAARLEHPGVVPVHDVGVNSDVGPYYTMKLVKGQTFEEAIRGYHANHSSQDVLEQQRLLRAFVAVCQTMAFAHARGVIHRDLKPANIVLGEFGETVILDWGLAKEERRTDRERPSENVTLPADSGDTVAGTILGTPAYMSPEQASGAVVDSRSDIFALGAILFHLLTGRPPFVGLSAESVLDEVRSCVPPRPRSVDAQIRRPMEAICLKALSKEPAERYPAAGQFARDVELFLVGERVSAYVEPWRDRVSRWARKHRTGVGVASVAVILLSIGSVTGFFLWREAENRREKQQTDLQIAFDRKQQEIRDSSLRALDRASRESELLAQAELRANRYAAAERHFRKAARDVQAEPELSDTYARLAGKRELSRRLAEFYQSFEYAERLTVSAEENSFGTPDEGVLETCALALKRIGALEVSVRWWDQLKLEGLPQEQVRRIEADVASVMMLRALWLSKKGLLEAIFLGAYNPEVARTSYRAARDLIGRLQAYHQARHGSPSPAVESIDLVCRHGLNDPGPLIPVEPKPRNAQEAYVLGTLHLIIGHPNSAKTMRGILSRIPAEQQRLSGLDFQSPMASATRLLREAVAMDPKHFWSHLGLAQSLAVAGDLAGAEEAFTACIFLRPEISLAYEERATLLLIEIKRHDDELKRLERPIPLSLAVGQVAISGRCGWSGLTDVHNSCVVLARWPTVHQTRLELLRRGVQGLDEAMRLHASDPAIHWNRAMLLTWGNSVPDALAASTVAAELEVARSLARGTQPNANKTYLPIRNWALQASLDQTAQEPNSADAFTALAFASLSGAKDAEAAQAAERALAIQPKSARALAIRGVVRLKRGSEDALADFDAALDVDPQNILAIFGRLRAIEKSGDANLFLNTANDLLAKLDPTTSHVDTLDWRILGVHLARARALVRLGRLEDAKLALEEARQIDIAVAETVKRELFN